MPDEVATETNGQEKKNDNTPDASEQEIAIIRQVEYYFGDLNLPRDKFLQEQVQLDDGWVPLDVLTKFKRLAQMTTDIELIANALEKSTSGLMELSEDKTKIRRSPEVPVPEMNEERRKEIMNRTVYAKGFPRDSVLDDLIKFFRDHGDVDKIIMRKFLNRTLKKHMFKGSVFVTFKTKEQAEKFVNSKDVKCGETELTIKWQEDYFNYKHEEHLAMKAKRGKGKTNTNNDTKKEDKEDFTLPTGTVLHFSEGNEKMTRENVKSALKPLGAHVAYVDFNQGDTEGWVRLSKEDSAKEIMEKLTDGKLKILESDVVFKLLEGEEEAKYLEKSIEAMMKRRMNQKSNRNKAKSFRGKGRKRRQGRHDDEPPTKVRAET